MDSLALTLEVKALALEVRALTLEVRALTLEVVASFALEARVLTTEAWGCSNRDLPGTPALQNLHQIQPGSSNSSEMERARCFLISGGHDESARMTTTRRGGSRSRRPRR